MKGRYEKERTKKSLWPVVLFIFFAVIFLFSAFQLYRYWSDNRNSLKQNEKMIQQAVSFIKTEPGNTQTDPTSGGDQKKPTNPEEQEAQRLSASIPIAVDFGFLHQENQDIIGWIYCEGTPINYPVVQGSDNQFYLKRLPDGSSNPNGSLFMDFRNDDCFGDLNTLIYGHNMKDNSMFGTLTDYNDQAYYEAHPQFWILTPERAYLLDLIAGCLLKSDSDAYLLYDNKEDLQAYLRTAIEESTFEAKNVDINRGERIVTLSTCSYEYSTARYVLIASMTPVEYPSAD